MAKPPSASDGSRSRTSGNRNHNSRIARSPSSTALSWCALMLSILRRNRSFVTARIWSTTATAARPSQVSDTKSGGLPAGELERGITTTVRRCWFTIFVVSTRQGRVLRISAPSVGSSLTHQTSPRRGSSPRFGGFFGDGVELFFNGSNLRIVVCDSARLHQMPVAGGEFFVERASQILGTFSCGNPAHKLLGQIFRQREGHLSGGHIPILPYNPPALPGGRDRGAQREPSFPVRRAPHSSISNGHFNSRLGAI